MEALYLVCGACKPQLMRISLGAIFHMSSDQFSPCGLA